MRRSVFDADHEALGEAWGLDREVAPVYDDRERARRIPRDVLQRIGALGFLAPAVPERFGGAGSDDFRFSPKRRHDAASPLSRWRSSSTTTSRSQLTTDDQQNRWLPGLASGERFAAIAISEPGTGSDLAAITTRARRVDRVLCRHRGENLRL